MKHCENCKWFGGYTGKTGLVVQSYHCNDPHPIMKYDHFNPKYTCGHFEERKDMSIKEAYKVLQAAWVKLYNVESGDIVKVLRAPTKWGELGYDGCETDIKKQYIGKSYTVREIQQGMLVLEVSDGSCNCFPFFCLELVKKAEPVIEIDVKINGVTSKLSEVSEETLLSIREQS